ncbi:DUF927 domain-containing protein [Rhodobacter aestuarii]|nr:DUF927 domain-containing protein [Rhodobacter aestuarii]
MNFSINNAQIPATEAPQAANGNVINMPVRDHAVLATASQDMPAPSSANETSPKVIEIPQKTDDSVAEKTIDAEMSSVPAPSTSSANQKAAQQIETESGMPPGYELWEDGVYASLGDDADPVLICSPLRIEAKFADHDNRSWGLLIQVRDDDGRWHDVPVLRSALTSSSKEVLARLQDHGLSLGSSKKAKESLFEILRCSKPKARLTSVPRFGWSDERFQSFVLGDTVIGQQNVLPMLEHGHGVSQYLKEKGTVESWRENIGEKCVGNPLMILAVSLAFSGPLLRGINAEGGGLHFRGTSSSGKTTLLRLAASVWGSSGLIGQWRATTNGLEGTAKALNDMVLPLDEIAEIAPNALNEAIYMLANGRAKSRMTKNATLAEAASWRLALISSGEISVEEKLKEAKRDAKIGHEVRLIDIEADTRTYGVFDDLHGASDAAAFADALRADTEQHHGAVGRIFAQRLSVPMKSDSGAKIANIVRRHANAWVRELPSAADGQIQRVARRFAILAVAGWLATEMELTGWGEIDASDAARAAFLDWYERRFGEKRDAADAFVMCLKSFLETEHAHLQEIHAPSLAQGEIKGWYDATRAYIPTETWCALFPGDAGEKAANALRDMAILLPGDGGRLRRRSRPSRFMVLTVFRTSPRWIRSLFALLGVRSSSSSRSIHQLRKSSMSSPLMS